MKMKKVYFLSICITFLSIKLLAQVSVKDSSIYTPYIGVSYGYQLAAGDLVKRFGNSSAVGGNLDFKTKNIGFLV